MYSMDIPTLKLKYYLKTKSINVEDAFKFTRLHKLALGSQVLKILIGVDTHKYFRNKISGLCTLLINVTNKN